ncbi:MAG: Sec-independent protein translocase protein TatB [Campylobacterota bacterium]|nr:Sec-independent protein translocase protein TatB [Campylobacterota bacterium]
MFGMGFMEIFLIAIVAIIALGPEKLPSAMVEIAKFFRQFKSGIEDAKSTINSELNIDEMKQEAAKFKQSVEDVKEIASVDLNDMTSLEDDNEEEEKPKKEKQKKKKDIYNDEKKETISFNEEVKA